jgi:nucleotidyltransferase substrate binding protein (TIGR01987 family)
MIDKENIHAKNTVFLQALSTLQEALAMAGQNVLMRDGAIQRFEYCFELAWKTLKLVIEYEDRETVASPKSILQKGILLGILEDEDEWFRMLLERNNSVHTYREALAAEIAGNLELNYRIMVQLGKRIEERYK